MRVFVIIISLLITQSNMLLAQGGDKSLAFDGIDDWLNCGTNSLGISGSITIETWVKGNDLQPTSYGRIIDKFNWNDKAGFNLVMEFPSSSGSAMFDFFATDGSENAVVGATKINDNKWHHVTATYDGNTMKIYIDGQLEGENIVGAKTIKASTNFLGIGNNNDGNQWFPFNGFIEEARVWDVALGSEEIRGWMYKDVEASHPFYSRLQGYWKFNDGSGSTAKDDGSKIHHGKLTSMDTIAAWQNSNAPIATNLTNSLEELSAVWAAQDSSASSILSIVDTINGDGVIIFGHNNADLSWNWTEVPDKNIIERRLNRVWRFEVYDTLKGEILIDLTTLLSADDEAVLLVSDQETFTNADTVSAELDRFSKLHVLNHSFKHGQYYTVGVKVGTANGLIGHYYQGYKIDSLGHISFNGLTKSFTRLDTIIDFWNGGQNYQFNPVPGWANNYSIEWKGYIQIKEEGQYGFGTISDDGSQIFINDSLIMDNGEKQWYDWEDNISEGDTSNTPFPPFFLDKGYHKISIRFYEDRSLDGIEVWWIKPGDIDSSDIPWYGKNFNSGEPPTFNPNTNWELIPKNVLFTANPDTIITSIGRYEEKDILPATIQLYQNYPNPFNPVTTIGYNLPINNHVKLTIYDMMGKKIKTVINSLQQAGFHKIAFDASNFASGVYFYRLQTNSQTISKKMILIR
ncbi:MAG: T9SS type A sorting domain-containing protein [Calditrichaeota bacterium]|nr:T9SS type A sorting domain-containing protein [Calditrichota bacterium]